jgi:hypothetical protein
MRCQEDFAGSSHARSPKFRRHSAARSARRQAAQYWTSTTYQEVHRTPGLTLPKPGKMATRGRHETSLEGIQARHEAAVHRQGDALPGLVRQEEGEQKGTDGGQSTGWARHAVCVLQSRAKRVRSGTCGNNARESRVSQRGKVRVPPPCIANSKARVTTSLGEQEAPFGSDPFSLVGLTQNPAFRHTRIRGYPVFSPRAWIPAFAGMTADGLLA